MILLQRLSGSQGIHRQVTQRRSMPKSQMRRVVSFRRVGLFHCEGGRQAETSVLADAPFGCAPRGANMTNAVLRTASFSLFFLLSVFAPAHAQAATSGAPTEPPSPLSAIVHDFTTWLNHVAGTGANRHSPPLPRPRPAAELAPAPVASNKEPSEFLPPPVKSKNKTPTPVQIND
jgi:hypothetical protein